MRPETRPTPYLLVSSVIMHVASPGLPEAALRHLFYRTATAAAQEPSRLRPPSAPVAAGSEAVPNTATATSPTIARKTSKGAGGTGGDSGWSGGKAGVAGGGGRGGDGEAPSTSALARAVVEFPLACLGLAPLIESTATELGARNLLKQVTYQAKQALDETEQVWSESRRCALRNVLAFQAHSVDNKPQKPYHKAK